jgi:RNA polymerase sigma factor (sigma-70 family)
VDLDTVLELDDALSRLEAISPRQAKAVELRFFGGLTLEETAEVLGTSAPTAMRDLRFAQAWLARELAG